MRTQLEEELNDVQGEIRNAFPAYAQLRYPEPLEVPAVQEVLASDELLLEYEATSDRTFVWAIRRSDLWMKELETTGPRLADRVNEAVGGHHRRPRRPGSPEATAELARLLLDAIPAPAWTGVGRLAIVPHGFLHYLPFEILPQSNLGPGLLADRIPIAYFPSATLLHNLRTGQGPGSDAGRRGDFIGFGDPAFRGTATGASSEVRDTMLRRFLVLPLPGSGREVADSSRVFGSRSVVYRGSDATEWRAKTEAPGFRYIHFATHGILDDRNPLYSGLLMAPPRAEELAVDRGLDDFLQVWEMFGLRLECDLVVCSACQTALGPVQEGEGLIGMSRALFFAGARSLVLSLWSVADESTAVLMGSFYRHLKRGDGISAALQAARIECRKTYAD